MGVIIDKSILEKFLERLVENRTGGDPSDFFHLDTDEEDEPIKPNEMLSVVFFFKKIPYRMQ